MIILATQLKKRRDTRMEWKNRSAYVFIKTAKGKADDVWKQFQKWDNVIGTWIVTGDWDVIVWFDIWYTTDIKTITGGGKNPQVHG